MDQDNKDSRPRGAGLAPARPACDDGGMDTVSFTQMRDGTRADYDLLAANERRFIAALPDRLIAALRELDHGLDGYPISRLEHSLQTATRAERDGAGIDWVVAALLHDIGDGLAPENHAQMAAAIIRPYVREEVTWAVQMHGVFQQHYYGHHTAHDPDAREAYRGHPWFDSCERFCERWDQAILRQVFSRAAFADRQFTSS
jgi:predicted HD phosphohydrolase